MLVVVKVMVDITTEIWPVSSRQISEKDHSSDPDKDVVPSSSGGQMMIGGEGSRRTGQNAPLGLGDQEVQGDGRPMHVSDG